MQTSNMPPSANAQQLALLSLLAGAMIIGLSPILVRLSDVSPLASAFYRVALALPLLWIISRRDATAVTTGFDMRLLIPGLLFAGDLALWHLSIHYTYIANATILANTAPLFVSLGAWLLLKEHLRAGFLFSMGLAMLGIMLLMSESMQMDMQHIGGDLLGLGTAVFYGLYLLSMRWLRRDYPTMILMWWSSLVSAVCLLPLALLDQHATMIPQSMQGWLILLLLAWLAHVAGQGLITYALAHLAASFSSVTLLLQPLVASLLAWQYFNEQLSLLQMSGITVTMIGIYLCKRFS